MPRCRGSVPGRQSRGLQDNEDTARGRPRRCRRVGLHFARHSDTSRDNSHIVWSLHLRAGHITAHTLHNRSRRPAQSLVDLARGPIGVRVRCSPGGRSLGSIGLHWGPLNRQADGLWFLMGPDGARWAIVAEADGQRGAVGGARPCVWRQLQPVPTRCERMGGQRKIH